MEPHKFDHLCKILILGIISISLVLLIPKGDTGVGKTSLIDRFTRGTSIPGVKLIDLRNKVIKIQAWIAPQRDKFRALDKYYYPWAAGALVVFDITNEKSFKNVEKWVKQLKKYADPKIVKTLVGAKSDLASQRAVSRDILETFAKENEMRYVEVSALDSTNVDIAFEQTVEGKRDYKNEYNFLLGILDAIV